MHIYFTRLLFISTNFISDCWTFGAAIRTGPMHAYYKWNIRWHPMHFKQASKTYFLLYLYLKSQSIVIVSSIVYCKQKNTPTAKYSQKKLSWKKEIVRDGRKHTIYEWNFIHSKLKFIWQNDGFIDHFVFIVVGVVIFILFHTQHLHRPDA